MIYNYINHIITYKLRYLNCYNDNIIINIYMLYLYDYIIYEI